MKFLFKIFIIINFSTILSRQKISKILIKQSETNLLNIIILKLSSFFFNQNTDINYPSGKFRNDAAMIRITRRPIYFDIILK